MASDLVVKINGVVINHTARRLAPVEPTPVSKDADDIVEFAWKQKVKKIGEGPDDYLVYEEPEEVSRINRQAYIDSQCSDIGVLNILEKVRRSGDITLLNQTGATVPDGLQDYTKVPHSVGEALKSVENGAESFSLLKNIFGDVSFNDLANMSEEQINAALNAYIAAHTKTTEGESK